MARPLGDTLPDVLHELLGGRDLAARIGQAILVDQAREDLEPGARLTGGITFDPGRPVKEALRNWQAMVDGLRREA